MAVSLGGIWNSVKGTVGDVAGDVAGTVVDAFGNRVDRYIASHVGGSGTGSDRQRADQSRVDAEMNAARQRAANTLAAGGLYAASKVAPQGSAYRVVSGLTPPMIVALIIGIVALIAYGVKK